jgi:succinate dehydrogenase/fumarate reductase flavoprotein subunit
METVLEKIKKCEEDIQRLTEERVAVYRSVQDMRASANKTDEAVVRMKNIDRILTLENKKLNGLKAKIRAYEESRRKHSFHYGR